MDTELFIAIVGLLALLVVVFTLGTKYWDLQREHEDLERRHKFVRKDRDNWKAAAGELGGAIIALRRQLAHVVVAANTTPAPTSPTDNETSAA